MQICRVFHFQWFFVCVVLVKFGSQRLTQRLWQVNPIYEDDDIIRTDVIQVKA